MFRVFIHRGTENLGDAMQTIALCRLLGDRCEGVYRDEALPASDGGRLLVANGWLGYRPPPAATPAVFAGIHIGRHYEPFVDWVAANGGTAGVRDPFTAGLLHSRVPVSMVSCATLTFDRYSGPRSGRYAVDVPLVPHTVALTQGIGNLDWGQQWERAMGQLDLLRRAEVVYTSRLHVLLPCLAFGTPIVFPLAAMGRVREKERLSLLPELGFVFGEPVTADVSAFAARYVSHLETVAGALQRVDVPAMPLPA